MMKEKIGEYRVLSKAGEGSFGKVYECLANDGSRVAVKEIDKSKLNEDLFEKLKTEAKISMDMNHQNIIKCFNTLQSSKNFYLVFEYCSGGDLQKYMKQKNTLELKEALFIMRQIRDAYRYLLQKSIIHRDIKLENILLQSKENAHIKLSDFGCSKVNPIGETYCGTPKYMALEIIEEKSQYNYKADLWAIGLCFWELLFGYGHFPFSTKTIENLKNDIRKYSGQNLRFPAKPQLPEIFYSFFRSVLNISPDLRMDSDQFINHAIFSYDPDNPSPASGSSVSPSKNLKSDFDGLRLTADSELGQGASPNDPATLKLLESVSKTYNERLLEIKLTCNTVVSMKEYLGQIEDAKFFSYLSGLCLILLSKTLIKAENALFSLIQKKNLYKIDGFEEFIKYPNQYNKFKEDFSEINERAKALDLKIYADLMERCFSDEYLQEIKTNIYHKDSQDIQRFYKTTFSYVQGNFKSVFDNVSKVDLEKQLKKVLLILRNKIIENLDIFYT